MQKKEIEDQRKKEGSSIRFENSNKIKSKC